MDDGLTERVEALERAITDGEHDLSTLADEADARERLETLETTIEEIEERVDELEAATQALRGYVGNIRSVNRDIEQQAELALAKVESLEEVGESPHDTAETTPEEHLESLANGVSESTDAPSAQTNSRATDETTHSDPKQAQTRTGAQQPAGNAAEPPAETLDQSPAGNTEQASAENAEQQFMGNARQPATEPSRNHSVNSRCHACGQSRQPQQNSHRPNPSGVGSADVGRQTSAEPTTPGTGVSGDNHVNRSPANGSSTNGPPANGSSTNGPPASQAQSDSNPVPTGDTEESTADELLDDDDATLGTEDPMVSENGDAGGLQRIRKLL